MAGIFLYPMDVPPVTRDRRPETGDRSVFLPQTTLINKFKFSNRAILALPIAIETCHQNDFTA